MRIFGVALLYLVTAKLEFLLAIHPGNVTAVWPPSGIALACLLLWSRRVWPGIWLGSFLANTWVFKGSAVGLVDLALGASIGGGSVLQALAGEWLLGRRLKGIDLFAGARQVFWFALVALVVCPIGSTIGVASLGLAGQVDWAAWDETWVTWWLGDLAGMLMVTPLMLAWGRPATTGHPGQKVEAGFLFATLALTGALSFGLGFDGGRYPLSFLIFPGLIWAALRFNERVVTLAIVGLAGMAIVQTGLGAGPFALAGVNESLLLLQANAGAIGLGTLITFAVLNELRKADASLRASEERWRLMNAAEPECVKLLGPDGSLRQMNPAGLRMIEADSFEQVAGQCVYPNVAAEHRAKFQELTERVFRGESGTLEFQFTGLRGTPRWMETHATPLRDDQGRVVSLLGITRDITGRKQAEAALRASEERFSLLNEVTFDVIWDLDVLTGNIWWNEHFKAFSGYGPEDGPLNLSFWRTRLHPEELAQVTASVRAALNSGRDSWFAEYQFQRKEGSYAFVDNRARIIRDATGRPVRMLGAMRDITARKQAEDSMRVSQEQFQILFQSSPLGASLFSLASGKLTDVNDRFIDLFGFSRAEVLGRSGVELGLWCDVAARDQLLERVHRDKQVQNFEARLRTRQGREFDALLNAQVVALATEPMVMVQALDITERKRAEEALRDKDEILRRVIDLAPIFIFAKDVHSRFIFANRTAAEALGLAPEELVGRNDLELGRSPEEAEAFIRDDREVITSGQPKFVPEETLTDATGRVRIHQTIKIPFQAPGTGGPAVLGVAVDITDRKRAEDALRASEARTSGIVGSAMDAIISADNQQRVVLFNTAAERMFGISAPEVLGQPLARFMPPRYRSDHAPNIERFGQTGVTSRAMGTLGQIIGLRANGEEFPIEASISQIGTGAQKIFTAILRDVTERKRTEARLSAFSELGRRLSAAETPRAASEIIVELADRLVGWDSCVVDLYSAVDDTISVLLCKDIVNGQRCEVEASSTDRFPPPRARRVLAHGGELELREDSAVMPPDSIPFGDVSRPSQSLMTVPIRDRDRPLGLLSIQSYRMRAYTPQDLELLQTLADHCGGAFHRLQAEEAVRASESRLRDAQRIGHLGNWEWDLSTDQLFWSDEIFRILELEVSRSRPLYESYRQLIHPEDREAVHRAYAAASKSREPYEITHRLLMPDGRTKWVQEQGEFILSAAGDPLSSRGTLQDITERRQMEEQFRQAQKMEAIGQLAGGIAHDFNNILGSILGNAQLAMADTAPDHPARECLEEIQKGGTRAKDLVQQILDFSRQRTPQRQVIDLCPIVMETVKLLRATIPAGVEIVSTLAAGVPPVLADATQMHQILMNLGTNAWHALGDQPGRIEFQLRTVELDTASAPALAGLRPGRFVSLSVSDTGKGIDEITRERLFEPFFTTKETGKGTGLGLSVVHGIVQSHEGAITVTSRPGQGSAFEVFLPVAAVPVADESEAPAAPPAGGSRRILLLDDEPALVLLVPRLLRRVGHQVTGFTNAAEALAAFRAAPGEFDLVITDYNMSGMSGLAVAADFLKVRPGIPILLNSGHVTDELRHRAQAAGIREVLLKPNSLEELAAAIGRHAPETSPRQDP